MKLSRQCLSCAAALFVAMLVTQPALAQGWKLVGSSADHEAGDFYPSLGTEHENLLEVNITDGSTTYLRGLRNDVDAELIAAGWGDTLDPNEPLFGIGYREGQSIAYNPNNGLLYNRNGSIGDGVDPTDQFAYDRRIIESYAPGYTGAFTADPTTIYNALLSQSTGLPISGIDPDYPIDATYWPESRDFTWNPRDNNFIITNSETGDIGTMDPTTFAATQVRNNAIELRGVSWYEDGVGGNRLFSMAKGGGNANLLFELETVVGPDYLDLKGFGSVIMSLVGAPGLIPEIGKAVALAQHPGTGDVYGIVEIDGLDPGSESRHLIRIDKADIDALNVDTDLFIDVQYIGANGDGELVDGEPTRKISALAFIPVQDALPGDGNLDGWVDGLDYLLWASNFGDNPADDPPGSPQNGDYNDDGIVSGLDYLKWAGAFGTHVAGTAVPEPGTFTLAGLALVGLLASRRRRR